MLLEKGERGMKTYKFRYKELGKIKRWTVQSESEKEAMQLFKQAHRDFIVTVLRIR